MKSQFHFFKGYKFVTAGIAISLLTLIVAFKTNDRASDHSKTLVHNAPGNEIITPEQADHYWIFPESKHNLGTGGELTVFLDHHTHPHAKAGFAKYDLGAGGELPQHKHEKTEEIAYFLSGEGIVKTYVEGTLKEIPVKPGYVWYTPPGVWHSFKNTGNVPLSLVFAVIPNEEKGLLAFFRKIGVKPESEPEVLPMDDFVRIATEHDLILKPAGGD